MREGRGTLHTQKPHNFCTLSTVRVMQDEMERTCCIHGRDDKCVQNFIGTEHTTWDTDGSIKMYLEIWCADVD
jgi:hypothetical protein